MFSDILMKVSLYNFNWVLEIVFCLLIKIDGEYYFKERGNEIFFEEIV